MALALDNRLLTLAGSRRATGRSAEATRCRNGAKEPQFEKGILAAHHASREKAFLSEVLCRHILDGPPAQMTRIVGLRC